MTQQEQAQWPAGLPPEGSPDEGRADEFAERRRFEPQRSGAPGAYDHATADRLPPLRDFHGLQLVIETPKDTRRIGHGWAVQMPCDYGYIRGTSSAEGPHEQMDAFLGPDRDSQVVWVIEQVDPDTGLLDEHKCMLGFMSRDEALDTYKKAFSDGSGANRIGTVRRMHIDVLKNWLDNWPAGKTNGDARVAQY